MMPALGGHWCYEVVLVDPLRLAGGCLRLAAGAPATGRSRYSQRSTGSLRSRAGLGPSPLEGGSDGTHNSYGHRLAQAGHEGTLRGARRAASDRRCNTENARQAHGGLDGVAPGRHGGSPCKVTGPGCSDSLFAVIDPADLI